MFQRKKKKNSKNTIMNKNIEEKRIYINNKKKDYIVHLFATQRNSSL